MATAQRVRLLSVKKLATSQECPLSSQALLVVASNTQTKKLQQLAFRAKEGRNKFTRRAFTALKRSRDSQTIVNRVAAEAAAQLMRKFTVNATSLPQVSSLMFQKPTKLFVKSEAEKKRAVV